MTRGRIAAYLCAAFVGLLLALYAPTALLLIVFAMSVAGVVVTMLAGRR